jgi:hypothetical protein
MLFRSRGLPTYAAAQPLSASNCSDTDHEPGNAMGQVRKSSRLREEVAKRQVTGRIADNQGVAGMAEGVTQLCLVLRSPRTRLVRANVAVGSEAPYGRGLRDQRSRLPRHHCCSGSTCDGIVWMERRIRG